MIKNLKLLREERGWSQQKVADMLNLTQQTVFKYEQKSNEPDIATLIRLADIFEVSVDFLIGNTDIREKNTNSKQPTLSKPEVEHIKQYRTLPDNLRRSVDDLLKNMNTSAK